MPLARAPRRYVIRIRGRRVGANRMRPRRGQVMRRLARGVHQFTRSQYYSGSINGSTLTDTFGGIYFRLGDLPNSSEFTNLFDMYRIDKVKIRFMPRANSAEVGSNQGQVKLFTAIDYDDITTPASIQELLQYENCKVSNTTNITTRVLKPKFASEVYQSATSTAYGARSGWIDCSNPLVQHYGIKWALQQLPAGSQSFDLHIKYYLSFKQTV